MSIIWTIIIGFLAGVIAKFIMPGDNEPSGFIMTTILGIVGAIAVAALLANFPIATSTQENCQKVPAGTARTDCYIGLSRLKQSNILLLAAMLGELSTTVTICLGRRSAAIPCRHLRIDANWKAHAIIARR